VKPSVHHVDAAQHASTKTVEPPPAKSRRSGESKRQKKPAPTKIQTRVDGFIERYQQRDALSYYELLGVQHDVETEELRRRFKKLVGELHIDQYLRFDFDEDTLEKLKQLFISINRANQVLSDPNQRGEYDLERELMSSGETNNSLQQKRDLSQLLHAEQLTREAVNFVKNGKLDLAVEKIKAALEINTDDPLTESVSIYIDGLRAKSGNASMAVLRQHIDRLEALVRSYESREEPFLYLGTLYGYCEEYKRGIQAVERALEINPHFAEAKSQLRHLQRLMQSATKKGGLFRRR
jgi:tetratricopeptide (TPR) repeat protein